jgi:hypothetical protein
MLQAEKPIPRICCSRGSLTSSLAMTATGPLGDAELLAPTTSLSCSSDARLKTNINSLTASSGLDALLQLDPVTYNWKTESATTSPHTGFIAQQVLRTQTARRPPGQFEQGSAGTERSCRS